MKTTISTYDKQATDFLTRYGVTCEITRADPFGPGDAPEWAEGRKHGNQYRVRLSRTRDGKPSGLPLEFDFWGSLNDAEKGQDPSAYDVLACVSGDLHCPETFEEFCGDYGYDTDSRRAEATFKRCRYFGEQLRAFFPEGEERESLSEIA